MTVRPAACVAIAATVVAVPLSAFAHGGADLARTDLWASWHFTPDIVVATLAVVAVYVSGMIRRRTATRRVPEWRHCLFLGGVAVVFLALQSPVDAIADRLFSVHQIQHMLLRMIAPMMLALAWPEGILIAGLPAVARRRLLAPTVASRTVRSLTAFLAHPAVATFLFIAALYFWEIPRFHNTAVLDDGVHYLMHVTMLAAGLLFWWRIFERRSAPHGLHYGVRLTMLGIAILSNILLGSYTALKSTVLYTAYDVAGRLFDYPAVTDERVGGIVIWIPSSMMCLVAALIVIHMWGLYETRMDVRRVKLARSGSNSVAFAWPTTGAAIIARARSKNRTMAVGIVAFVSAVFASVVLVGVMHNLTDHATITIAAPNAPHPILR